MTAPFVTADGFAAFPNPRAAGAAAPYGDERARTLNAAGFAAAAQSISQWPGYAPTPLYHLPALARRLGVQSVWYKDESERFELKSFKALGGAYAVFRLIAKAIANANDGLEVEPADVLSGRYRDIVSSITVTCATDGNHGRSVAWGASLFGCRCVIFVHATVSQGRCDAISRYGAKVVRVPGNYDDSIRHAAAEAERNGWIVVSDTTYEGYRDIPLDVMHGYGVMSREIMQQLDAPPTHVIVQAGVGALAASVCASFWLAWGESRPCFIMVEPEQADCFLKSALAGEPVAVHGDLDTVMAGLACGEVSPVAWDILREGADVFSTVADRFALDAMRVFANPDGGDPAIVSGETGAAGLALLTAARDDESAWRALGLGPDARVLLIGSEGDTDPGIYHEIVGRDASKVRQQTGHER